MARISLAVSINNGNPDLAPSSVAGFQTAAAASVATLVADGASPTQGHVTTHNSDWTALYNALNQHVTLIYDVSAVTSLTILRNAVEALLRQAAGRGEIK